MTTKIISFTLYFALVFILTDQVFAQNTVTNWFPVHAGDKWTYEHETRDIGVNGNLPPFEIHRWKTEETTIGSWTIPEGIIVGKQVRITEGLPPTGWRNYPPPNLASLIRGNCIYIDAASSATHQLSQDTLEGLSTYLSPDFCFPLVVHKTWGAPHGLPDWGVTRPEDAKDWKVTGMEIRDPSISDKQGTFHITAVSSYPGSGMTVDIWFEKGVGIVREDEIHHGTIGEERTRLLHFEPAPRN